MRFNSLRLHLAALTLITLAAAPLQGQASRYIALDDPALALFEHLIARGVITDPTPFVRPIRRAEAVAVLLGAKGDSANVQYLLRRWSRADSLWEGSLNFGGESFTAARLDGLHPGGIGGTRVHADLNLAASLGKLILVTRPTLDQRASLDPDWPGLRADPTQVCCRWRFPEAYLSYQPGAFRLYYGAVGRNWGPVGIAGIAMSNIAYARQEIGMEVRSHDLHMLSTMSQLQDTKSKTGATIHRYHVASRFGVQLSERVHVAAWQTTIVQGVDRSLEGPFRNPLMLLPLANQFGMGDVKNNAMVGVQAQFKLKKSTTLQIEAALDDIMLHKRDSFPDRYAFTVSATGPAIAGSAYRAMYTRASSLAFRTMNPNENFTENGIGLGRGFADNDQFTLTLSKPVAAGLLGAAEITYLRQGEGRLDAAYNAITPMRGIFLGTVERTLRVAGHFDGRVGPFALTGEAGVNHLTNADHVAGRTANRLEGRLTALINVGTSGKLR